jgi:hypothetical protein
MAHRRRIASLRSQSRSGAIDLPLPRGSSWVRRQLFTNASPQVFG